MAWMSVADRIGRGWRVDLDRVSQIFYSEAFSFEKHSRARIRDEDNGIYPDTVRIIFNFHNMRSVVRAKAVKKYRRFLDTLYNDGSAAFEILANARMDAVHKEAVVRHMQDEASSRTARNLDSAVNTAEAGLEGARFTRDLSANVLIIGSSLIAPGSGAAVASVAALAAGSALQGTGTYQDTGNIGAAVLQGTTSFVFGLIPLGPTTLVGRTASQLSRAESRALFVVGIQNDILSNVSVSLALGQDVQPALINAATNAGLGAVVGSVGDNFFKSLAYPIEIIARHLTNLGRGAVSSAVTEAMTEDVERPIAPIRGHLSPSCAVVAARANVLGLSPDQRHAHAENFVRLYAMSLAPEMILPTSQQNFRWQLERMVEGM